MKSERTSQQLDPVGVAFARPVTMVSAALAFAAAVFFTLQGRDQISIPMLAVLALIVFGANCVLVILASSPYRAPVRRWVFVGAVVLSVVAALLMSASQWGTNTLARDDWGSLTLGLLLVAFAQYRPAAELAVGGTLAAIVMGVLAYLQSPTMSATLPWPVYVIAAMTPLLLFTAGAAAYSARIVVGELAWRQENADQVKVRAQQIREELGREVHDGHTAPLDADVVPFLKDVLARNALTGADSERARQLGRSIRLRLVAEGERSWLDTLLGAVAPGCKLTDHERIANRIDLAQRASLRAFLDTLLSCSTVSPATMVVRLSSAPGERSLTLQIGHGASEQVMRGRLAPYMALMRSVFTSVTMDIDVTHVTLKTRMRDAE